MKSLLRWSLAAAAILYAVACTRPQEILRHQTRALMGTQVEITVRGSSAPALDDASDAAYREMSRLSDMMNHYDPASVVSEINRQAGKQPVSTPGELMDVLQMAQAMSRRTGGAFDITVASIRGWKFRTDDPQMPTPEQIASQLGAVGYKKLQLDASAHTAYLTDPRSRIDLGGIAKLYILDAGMRVLKERGIGDALINGGGDIAAAGRPSSRPWRIGIRDPDAPGRLRWTLEISSGFVSSSGDYERYFIKDARRYHHILDPATGYPTQGPRAVTLVGMDLKAIDGLSCAIMVKGAQAGRKLIEETPGLEGLIVDRDGSAWVSPALRSRIHAPAPASAAARD